MAIRFVKQASLSAHTGESEVRDTVAQMLAEIEAGGEARAREYARKLDRWEGDIVVSRETIKAAGEQLSSQLRDDIAFAHRQVRDFARAQLDSMQEFDVELSSGLRAGQRLVPMSTAGCYVPGGRFAHVASALMSVTTARVAGVDQVIACSPTHPGRGVHPAILYTLDLAGADTVLALGGVQGVAALAFGLFTGHAAEILVGPGNQYVAEAKRLLYGRVGIDLFAGPTEVLVIADETADPRMVAIDLVGQAEHGPNSPAWLVSTSAELADQVLQEMPGLIADLPDANRASAEAAWRDYGEVVVVDTREEAVSESDRYAPEHLEVQAADLD